VIRYACLIALRGVYETLVERGAYADGGDGRRAAAIDLAEMLVEQGMRSVRPGPGRRAGARSLERHVPLSNWCGPPDLGETRWNCSTGVAVTRRRTQEVGRDGQRTGRTFRTRRESTGRGWPWVRTELRPSEHAVAPGAFVAFGWNPVR